MTDRELAERYELASQKLRLASFVASRTDVLPREVEEAKNLSLEVYLLSERIIDRFIAGAKKETK